MYESNREKELSRLRALEQTGLLDSTDEEAFDRLTRLASRALSVPVALISLVDKDRQFFKSQHGLPSPFKEARETPLSHSFCQHVAASGDPLIVEDARDSALVRSNLAIRDLGVIAYAGVPLTDSAGKTLGSLCAIDSKPRKWTPDEIDLLRSLAAHTMSEIEVRTRERLLVLDLARLQRSEAERRAQSRLTIHDLRTPLNSLVLNLDVLADLQLNEEQKEWTELAQRSARALSDIVDDLVDSQAVLAKGAGALAITSCSPRVLVDLAVAQIRGAVHGAKLKLSVTADDHIPQIEADERKIVRVLVNLLGNAIKFTPPGGNVAISLKSRGNDKVEFTVKDSGIGFDQSKSKQIFDPGVVLDSGATTNRSTGWGLEFCKLTVSAHGGTIEASSAVGEGSVFTVTLPISRRV